jgi:hypothetical protein
MSENAGNCPQIRAVVAMPKYTVYVPPVTVSDPVGTTLKQVRRISEANITGTPKAWNSFRPVARWSSFAKRAMTPEWN